MPFIIDGHNLIGQMPGGQLAEADDEQRLVVALRAYLRRVKRTGTVVFDQGGLGERPSLGNRQLAVRFARPPRTADDVILDLVRQTPNPRGLTVVTSDRRVGDLARQHGAAVKDAGVFLREMRTAPPPLEEKTQSLSPAEVEAWEREFKKRSGPPRS